MTKLEELQSRTQTRSVYRYESKADIASAYGWNMEETEEFITNGMRLGDIVRCGHHYFVYVEEF